MDFTASLRQKAAALHKTIVLPEAGDERMLRAAGRIRDEGFAAVVLLGDQADIEARLAGAGHRPDRHRASSTRPAPATVPSTCGRWWRSAGTRA